MEREEIEMNIWQKQTWFDTYYAQHEQKYRRLYTLKQKCDDGADPYEKLVNLYAEAEINRKEIQRLEELLNG